MKAPLLPTRGTLLVLLLGAAVSNGGTAGFEEDFASDPAQHGWRAYGDVSLFQWNSGSQSLAVTWDSTRPNSCFCRPLGNILAKDDDFALRFDLRLDSIQTGVNPTKPSTFEIAVGLLNLGAATNAGFNRGTGRHSPHLVEFTYFPAADFIAATVSPVLVSSNSQFSTSFTFPLEITTGEWFHVELHYTASNQTLVTTMTRNGAPFGPIQDVKLNSSFTDFRVDTVAVSSYSDSGDAFGSVRAHGTVDNVSVTLPPTPLSHLTASFQEGFATVEFLGRTNWLYTLERTDDLRAWTPVPPARSGAGNLVTLSDTVANGEPRFYRVRAERP